MDFLALFLCSVVLHKKFQKVRILISSAIGALYGVFQQIFELNTALAIFVCILIAIIMCEITYKEKNIKHFMILLLMYLFVSATLGGIMSLLYSFFNRVLAKFILEYSYNQTYSTARTVIIFGITALVAVIFSKILSYRKNIQSVEVKFKIENESFVLSGLCDTGNMLKEPFSGKYVILVSKNSKIGKMIENLDEIKKRYIPYKDITGKGIIKGIFPKEIEIDGRKLDAMVATVNNQDFNGYDALIPGALM